MRLNAVGSACLLLMVIAADRSKRFFELDTEINGPTIYCKRRHGTRLEFNDDYAGFGDVIAICQILTWGYTKLRKTKQIFMTRSI